MKITIEKVLLLVLVSINSILSADQAQYNKIANPQINAREIYRLTDALKVATIAVDSYITNPITQQALDKWTSWVTDANTFVINQVKSGKAPQQFIDITAHLYTILNFCVNTGNQLYTQKNNLSPAKINQLIVQAESYYKQALEISNTILEKTPFPQSWVSTVPKNPKSIVIKSDPAKPGDKIYVQKQLTYEEFFKGIKDIDAVKKLTPAGFKRFLYLKDMENKWTITDALNSFQKLSYRFNDLSKNRGWFDWKDYSKEREYSNVFVQKIKEAFPDIISPLDTNRFLEITDKATMILFVQAAAYEGVLTRIMKDLNSLKPKAAQ